MSNYFLGIDVGGTSLKACIFDENGKLISVKSVNTPVTSPAPGFYERDMDKLDEAIATVIKGALEKSGAAPKDVKCIGATGHGKGLYLAGKNGEHVRPAIASTDFRAESIVKRWNEDGTAEKARKIIMGPIVSCQPAPLLLWLRENEKESYDKIGYIFEAKDYVRFFLTGEAFAEESDSSGTALVDIEKRQFSKELFELYGIGDMYGKAPQMKTCTDICGKVSKKCAELTGLSEGTPVAGGMFDIDACALSSGKLSDEDICVVTGTWSINEFPAKTPETKEKSTKVSLYCDGNSYLIEESSPTSAGNLEWALNTVLKKADYGEANEIAASYKGDECSAVFLPFLYGSIDGFGAGTFAGLTTETKEKDLIRAVFEGVAFSHRVHIERLLKTDPCRNTLKVSGGAAKSDIWMRIFADITGMKVIASDTKETGALGVCMAAAYACGIYKTLEEAQENMLGNVKIFYPDMDEHKKYDAKFALFKKLIDCYEGV